GGRIGRAEADLRGPSVAERFGDGERIRTILGELHRPVDAERHEYSRRSHVWPCTLRVRALQLCPVASLQPIGKFRGRQCQHRWRPAQWSSNTDGWGNLDRQFQDEQRAAPQLQPKSREEFFY